MWSVTRNGLGLEAQKRDLYLAGAEEAEVRADHVEVSGGERRQGRQARADGDFCLVKVRRLLAALTVT